VLLSRYVLHGKLLWRAGPWLSICCVLLSISSAAAITGVMVCSGRLIGSINTGATWRWFVTTAILLVIGPLGQAVISGIEEILESRYLATYYDLVLDTGVRPYGIGHLEDPRAAHRISEAVAATRDWLFLRGINGTWGLLSTRLGAVGAFVVTARWRWWAPLLSIVAWLILSRAITRWNSARFDDLIEETGVDRRRARYLRTVLSGRGSAKEIRLFGLLDWLRDNYVATWQQTMAVLSRNRAKRVRGTVPPMALVVVVTGGLIALLAHDSLTGRSSTASLVTLVQAILGLSGFGPAGDDQSSMARLTSSLNQLANYRRDLGLPVLPDPPTAVTTANSDPRPATVEFSDVTFHYPGSARPVLDHLDLIIPAGQSIAIVGVNGAGKSTLIKLLCGLYPASGGAIRIDGTDPGTERPGVSVVFQEFIRYGLSERANIEAGAGWHEIDDSTFTQLERDAHVHKLTDRDTVLSAEYSGGTDLSGGQWQRIALARALAGIATGAGVLILDEPTSALDARAEAELFDQLLTLSRGATTILVSHRLSSVRHVDRIVVLDGGRLVEDGTHEELLAVQGEYAHMFRLQAARFEAAGGVR
jgi:ABC-type multidrug transport system fused ATPase/permease subunit